MTAAWTFKRINCAVLMLFLSTFSLVTLANQAAPDTSYKTLEWTDLIPADDLEALLNPPDYIANIEDGSALDAIDSQMKNDGATITEDRYQQALVSSRVVPEYHDTTVRVPGFIVPIEFDDNQKITQFFLVPYFGACIHLPPPPPNQIIFVDFPKGLILEALYMPFWISGVLKTETIDNDVAMSAYSMLMHSYERYEE